MKTGQTNSSNIKSIGQIFFNLCRKIMHVFQSTPGNFSIKPILLVTVIKQLTIGFVMELDSELDGEQLWYLSFSFNLHRVCNHMNNTANVRDIRPRKFAGRTLEFIKLNHASFNMTNIWS